jgi:protein tyrosine phosphatase
LNPEEIALAEQLKYQMKTMKSVGGRRLAPHLASRFLLTANGKPMDAWALAQNFLTIYGAKSLLEVNPKAPAVWAKLNSGEFVSFEKNGFGFLIYRASKHASKMGLVMKGPEEDVLSSLAAACYHLLILTESLAVQRNGITFVYDMSNAGWSNSDSVFSTSLLEIILAFPCRMMPPFLVNAPFWMRTSQSFVQNLTPILSTALLSQVPATCLPVFLGGMIPWADDTAAGTQIRKYVSAKPEVGRLTVAVDGPAAGGDGPSDVLATPTNQRPPPKWYAGRATPVETCIAAVNAGLNGDFLVRVTPDGKVAVLMVKDENAIAEFPIDIASGQFICGKIPHNNLEHVVANLSRIPVMNPKTKRKVQLNAAAKFGRRVFDPLAGAPLLVRSALDQSAITPRLVSITRSPGEPLGLKIYTTESNRGNRVGQIVAGKAASRQKNGLQINDVILEVNGWKCLDAAHEAVLSKLKLAGDVVSFLVVTPAGVPLMTPAEKQTLALATQTAKKVAATKAAAAAQTPASAQAQAAPTSTSATPQSPTKARVQQTGPPQRRAPPAWYAGKTTPLATCVKMVEYGKTGCFLIRISGDGKKAFLMVKDETEVAEFVINLEGGRFEFGGRPHKNLEEIVSNLQKAPVRGLSGRAIILTAAAKMPAKKKKKAGKNQPKAEAVDATGPTEASLPPIPTLGLAAAVEVSSPEKKKKALPTPPGGESPKKKALPTPPENAAPTPAETEGDKIEMEEFDGHVRALREVKAVPQLFNQLQQAAAENTGTYVHARDPANKAKNRYTNVHPYDHSRVVLKYPEGEGTGDYINANYVDGYNRSNEYLCCQGPLPKTVVDFWQMVWQEGVVTIAMLNKLQEGGRQKCEKYWPDVDEVMVEGAITITGQPSDDDATVATDVIKRVFTVQEAGADPRIVTQYQFTGWPDFGIPNTADGVLDICRIIEDNAETSTETALPPVVVHCSAGIGRTGTFCTIDVARKMLAEEEAVDVIGILKRLREQRPGMVQAPEQLDFCYSAVLEHIEMTQMAGMGDDEPENNGEEDAQQEEI